MTERISIWQALTVPLLLIENEYLKRKLNQRKVELAAWASAATPDEIEAYKLQLARRIGECESQGDEEGVEQFSEMLAVVQEHGA
jgi:hypothetical protein